MTESSDLDTSPARSSRIRALLSRRAGLLAASTTALAWTALALRQPETTYHFAPMIVAASWGAARRWVDAGPGRRASGLATAGGGGAIAVVTAAELAWLGALEGPTLWGTGGALVEAVAFAAIGAAIGYRFVTRRRPGLLFAA